MTLKALLTGDYSILSNHPFLDSVKTLSKIEIFFLKKHFIKERKINLY
jgi:hypothetical protein